MSHVPSWGKVVLFLSSYSPLYLIVALRAHDAEYVVFQYEMPASEIFGVQLSLLSVVAIVLTVVSVAFLWAMLWTRRTRQGQQDSIEQYWNRSDMFTEYLLVYVFPFVVFDFADLFDVAAFGVLFLTVAAIVIRSNRLYINPVLVFFRYRVYEVETPHDRHLLLTKQALDGEGDVTLNTAKISSDVYIVTK